MNGNNKKGKLVWDYEVNGVKKQYNFIDCEAHGYKEEDGTFIIEREYLNKEEVINFVNMILGEMKK